MDSRVDLLTEEQRDVLRRYLRREETKEIARSLGITPSAVEQRFQRARARLGVARTIDAARLLAEHESAYRKTTWGPSALPDEPADALRPASQSENGLSDRAELLPKETVDNDYRSYGANLWPFPRRGSEKNDLSPAARLLWMALGLILLLSTVAMLMNAVVAIDALLKPRA